MSPRWTLLWSLLLLICVLGGLFLWAGTLDPNIQNHRYPDSADVAANPELYVGASVEVSGTVIETNPAIITVTSGTETQNLEITNVEKPISEGETVFVFGTLQDTNTIEANSVVSRTALAERYMLIVSFVAGLWVLARLIKDWEFGPDKSLLKPQLILKKSSGNDDA